MKKSIELLMAKQFAELAVCNLDAVMKDDSLSDKEYNAIREAHDSIASARDAVERLTKPQRMVSAEAKESGYGESEDKEKPNGGIVLEDFNEGDGFYKVNLAYLSKEQVEEIENIAKKWNPELKESDDEDERIRKMLIKFFGKGAEYNSSTNGIFDKDILTWLEKQGTSYTKRDVDDAYVEGMAFAKNELEKQKSSWSEDDDKMKDLIISVLEVNHSKGIFKVGLRAIRTEEIVSWLKFLKQRYTWKPSKEQMDAMQMAVSYFGYKMNINRTFIAGAEWVLKNLWKSADGDELPEIDREVIALLSNGKVVYTHRPQEYWDGKNIITNEVTRYEPKRYDKGGWNQPNVKWWLDLELPKMEE